MTVDRQKRVTRLIAISDLHLGGVEPHMMSQPKRLADFISSLPKRLQKDETLELVIAGDFIDFLAIPEFKSWTYDPVEACEKLDSTMCHPSFFVPVFNSLAHHVSSGHRLTVIIGNHDIELALLNVQDVFLQNIGANTHQGKFVDDGSAYRVGSVLIEHGNRYDPANENDWEGLRNIRSALSRNEFPLKELKVSIGSNIVEKLVNPIKPDYSFIDLLQPQDELLAYLLFAFEPKLFKDHITKARHLLKVAYRNFEKKVYSQLKKTQNHQPVRSRAVASETTFDINSKIIDELKTEFEEIYQEFEDPSRPVGASDWLLISRELVRREGLAFILERGERIPRKRLRQIRTTMRRWNINEAFDIKGDTGLCGEAAESLSKNPSIDLVIMGHTHLARHLGPENKAAYINTGTWTDLIAVPDEALRDSDEALDCLEKFLTDLYFKRVCQQQPSYADVRIDTHGKVEQARLEFYND